MKKTFNNIQTKANDYLKKLWHNETQEVYLLLYYVTGVECILVHISESE